MFNKINKNFKSVMAILMNETFMSFFRDQKSDCGISIVTVMDAHKPSEFFKVLDYYRAISEISLSKYEYFHNLAQSSDLYEVLCEFYEWYDSNNKGNHICLQVSNNMSVTMNFIQRSQTIKGGKVPNVKPLSYIMVFRMTKEYIERLALEKLDSKCFTPEFMAEYAARKI